MITTFIVHNRNAKFIPNCDVSFANGEIHQACGHVTFADEHGTKIRSQVGRRLPISVHTVDLPAYVDTLSCCVFR